MDDKLETWTKAKCILCLIDCPMESHQQVDRNQIEKQDAALNFAINHLEIGMVDLEEKQSFSTGNKDGLVVFLPTLCDDCSRRTGRIEKLVEISKKVMTKLGESFESLHGSIQARLNNSGEGRLRDRSIENWQMEIMNKCMMKREKVEQIRAILNGKDQSLNARSEPHNLSNKTTTQPHPAPSSTATGNAPTCHHIHPTQGGTTASMSVSSKLLATEYGSSSENPSNHPTLPIMSNDNERHVASSPAPVSSLLQTTPPTPATQVGAHQKQTSTIPATSPTCRRKISRKSVKKELKREKGRSRSRCAPYEVPLVAARSSLSRSPPPAPKSKPKRELQRADLTIRLSKEHIKLFPHGTTNEDVEDVVWEVLQSMGKTCEGTACFYCGTYLTEVTAPAKHITSKHLFCIASTVSLKSEIKRLSSAILSNNENAPPPPQPSVSMDDEEVD